MLGVLISNTNHQGTRSSIVFGVPYLSSEPFEGIYTFGAVYYGEKLHVTGKILRLSSMYVDL